MESIWKKTAELPEFHTLTKDIRTKVLIIGGGMAGILCAYFLQRSGVDYCLLEADTICSGVTLKVWPMDEVARSTGLISFSS